MKKAEENAIEYFWRICTSLNYELVDILNDLPTIPAIVEFFELWSKYDTDFLDGVIEAIESGESPQAYNDFVDKYKLEWNKF